MFSVICTKGFVFIRSEPHLWVQPCGYALLRLTFGQLTNLCLQCFSFWKKSVIFSNSGKLSVSWTYLLWQVLLVIYFLGGKKAIKVFPVLLLCNVNITQQWIPYIFLSVFIWWEWDLERAGEPKKENNIQDLKIKIHLLSQHPFSCTLDGIRKKKSGIHIPW